MITRRTFTTAATAAALGAIAPAGEAFAAVPESVRIFCGFPAGGTADTVSRRLAEKLRGVYAPNVVVENRTGAGGQIAITALRDAPKDGSALLISPSSCISIYPYTYPKLPYNPQLDLQPITVASYFSHAFGVGPAVPAQVKTLRDFLNWARANPDKANYGSPAAGSMPHLIAALMGIITGTPLRHVAYRGSGPGLIDMMGGQIAAMSCPVGEYLPHLKTGKVRLLAISGTVRSKFVPETPTFRQEGIPITVREWFGLFASSKVDPALVRRAAAYAQVALANRDLVAGLETFGMEAQPSSPDALRELMIADAEEWRRLIKRIGFTADT